VREFLDGLTWMSALIQRRMNSISLHEVRTCRMKQNYPLSLWERARVREFLSGLTWVSALIQRRMNSISLHKVRTCRMNQNYSLSLWERVGVREALPGRNSGFLRD